MAAPVGPVSAAQAIGEYLQSPDDLVKISAFRKKLEKEKASIDSRLKIGVKEQLQATKLGLKKYLGTRDNVQAIKDEMMTIEKECEDPSVRVTTFDQISRVSTIAASTELGQQASRSLWSIGILKLQKRWSTIFLPWEHNWTIWNICSQRTNKT